MRILALNLRAFGPFSDFDIDLSDGHFGVHVLYGPNEAGKSTTLRALEQLLFGIPVNSADNFLHPYQKLRIAATLVHSQGNPLTLVRRKGNKNTLLEADDKTPVDEAVLARFLGGLDQRMFTTMFGINHQRLQEGGRAMATGGGKAGATLFAAASGISHLEAVSQSLEGEAKKLFTARPSKAVINTNLAALKDARKSIREAQLPSSEWVEHERLLREANQRLLEIEAEFGEASRQSSRLGRVQQALPLVVARKATVLQQSALGDVPILPGDFAEQRRETVALLAATQKAEHEAYEAIGQLSRQIEQLDVPDSLLSESKAIDRVRERLSVHRSAQNDRLELGAKLEQLRRDAAALLARLRPDLNLETVDQLRLASQQKVGIQNLGNRRGALEKQLEQARAEIEQLQVQLGHAEETLEILEMPRDARSLRDAARRAQGQGDLDLQAASAQAEADRLERQAAVELKRLPLWSGTLEALEELAVPGTETIDHFDDRLSAAEQDLTVIQRDRKDAEARLAEYRRQHEELQLQGDVPSEADLAAARRHRELGWQLVLEAWQSGPPDAARLEEFLAAAPQGADLASAYLAAVHGADDVADRLRREAHRVAQRAALQSNLNKIQQEIEALDRKLQAARSQRQRAWQAWVECWNPLGIEPRWPREMRAWLERQRALVTQADSIRNSRNLLAQIRLRIAACRQELSARLVELGEPEAADHESLGALVGRCQELVDHIASVADQRQRLDSERQRLVRQAAAATQAAEQAQARLAQWQEQWTAAIQPLGLPPGTPPEVANEFVARLDDLFERLEKAKGYASRIEEIQQYAEQFQDEVRTVARRVDEGLANLDWQVQAEELVQKLRAATANSQKLKTLVEQRDRHEAARGTARRTIDQLIARLEAMCQEAGCQDPDELPAAIKASDEALRLRNELRAIDGQLMQLCGGVSLESLIAEVEAVDADRLPIQRAALADKIAQLEAERGELRETRGRQQKTLETLDTNIAAADAAEDVEDLLARIETDALAYARLRIASAVLREAVERYRKKNEDPVLCRASELFRRLTLGSFTHLRADIDERGENVLVGVRGDGSDPVGLAGMSDGTCDQLYLALRLASLEQYLRDNEPMPLVVDDILISFDDRRASAALEVLGEIARSTQVLFFTHHQRLVELAEASLPADQRFIHRLPGRRPA